MGNDSKGRFIRSPDDVAELALASAARTTNSNSAGVEVGDLSAVLATLTVTAHGGTNPTLDVKLQASVDGSTWVDVEAFTQMDDDGTVTAILGPIVGTHLRWAWTIGGTDTPTFTFAIGSVKAQRDD